MNDKTKIINLKDIALETIKWLLISLFLGVTCGVVGSLFSLCITFVTNVRSEYGFILLFLPLGAVDSVLIYRLFNTTAKGTDDAIESARTKKKASWMLAPAIFICSAITHLFGGSAGREGAALKMGGGIASIVSDTLHLNERDRRTAIVAGMSGVFSAVFGTPIGAAVFTIEVVRSKNIRPFGILSCAASSFGAFGISRLFGIRPERFSIGELPEFSLKLIALVILVGALGGIVSYLFCASVHLFPKYSKKVLKNDYLRAAIFSVAIVILTVVLKTTDYNGGGIHIIEGIFEGNSVGYEAFALKILFTALTVAAGLKGGEIIPAFFVGATFGAAAASILGIPLALGAAVGMAALFCGVTNCPVATLVLSVEMFGINGILFYLFAIIASFICSGKKCLYKIEKFPFKELKEEEIIK